MSDEEAFQAYLVHPDTNRLCFERLMQDCMADADQVAVTKAINFVMNEERHASR